ncbi:hypothetical protein OSB04_004253 [Centaurea solstitialis]|uniref:F-box domain-containing protein n=1 Tax=Centaurea solstitialis TaxID=347529 RepID=A0AA38UD82_9ASTR|nr:hypothetical protein OSB04_004253 [Centaurea solstitialis]
MRRRGEQRSWARIWDGKRAILDPRDSISRLPENVLNHIISFLPTTDKKHVQFLSRKWNRVYAQSQKKLTLKGVRLNEQRFLRTLLDVFPSVEELNLEHFSGIKKLKLVNYKLKTIKLFCGSLKSLDLTTPDLEYFEFVGFRLYPCRIELGICKSLMWGCMDNMMFADCDSSFPVLQALTLFGCDMTGDINISSSSLDYLALLRFKKAVDVTIDAPNLREFEYSGSRIVTFVELNVPDLEMATIELEPDLTEKRDEIWYRRLFGMLEDLNDADYLALVTDLDRLLIIHDRYRGTIAHPLDGFKKVVTWSTFVSKEYRKLLDTLFWLYPEATSFATQCRQRADANVDYDAA